MDVTDDNSIATAYDHVAKKYGHLDILVNNAGVQLDPQYYEGKMTMREMWNESWNVNTTGSQIVTHTFIPLLLKSADARLLFVTSGTSTLAESNDQSIFVNRSPAKGWPKGKNGVPAYRSSKTGLNMLMREWSRTLKEDGVKVWCISPGYLATGLGTNPEFNKKMGAVDPATGAELARKVVEGSHDHESGQVVRHSGPQPW